MHVLSLFDRTGVMVLPWLSAGHTAETIDIQQTDLPSVATHTHKQARIPTRLTSPPDIIFAFPPCTDLAVSGARWWHDKRMRDADFQNRAVALARIAETLGELYGVPWMIENPVGAMSRLWRPPDTYIHPYWYTDLCPPDNYTKKTGLWYGRGFCPPRRARREDTTPPSRTRIHHAASGNARSPTPLGFARAVFRANNKELQDRCQKIKHK